MMIVAAIPCPNRANGLQRSVAATRKKRHIHSSPRARNPFLSTTPPRYIICYPLVRRSGGGKKGGENGRGERMEILEGWEGVPGTHIYIPWYIILLLAIDVFYH